jgi:hypothetical protein
VTRREAAFLLIGLSVGLMFSVAAAVEILLSLYRSAFITAYNWDKVMLLFPFLLLLTGLFLLLYRGKSKA